MTTTVHLSAIASVRRTANGDSLTVNLKTNGVPLFQGLNPDTFTVSPAWTAEQGKHPIITPTVSSANRKAASLSKHVWLYNGTDLGFAMTGSGWETSTVDGRFQMNHADGSLAIVGNLASKTNQDSDQISYIGLVKSGDTEFQQGKSIDIMVSMLGGSSYFGGVTATTTILSKGEPEAVLTPWLFNSAGGTVTNYSINLYRGNTSKKVSYADPSQGITIHRDKTDDDDLRYVDSHQLFILEFLVDNSPVYRTGISIDDISDLYQLTLNSEGQVSDDTDQVFRAVVTNCETGKAPKTISGNVDFSVYTDENGDVKEIRKATIDWATNVSTGFAVKDADTRDKQGNIIGVSVSCDANLTISE